jgi:hypothetical protein
VLISSRRNNPGFCRAFDRETALSSLFAERHCAAQLSLLQSAVENSRTELAQPRDVGKVLIKRDQLKIVIVCAAFQPAEDQHSTGR